MPSLVVLFLLCLSMHVCNARHLGIICKETSKQVYHFGKDVEKTKLHESSIQSRLGPSISEEFQTQKVRNGKRKAHDSFDGANTMKPKNYIALLKEEEGNVEGITSGSVRNEIEGSYFKENWQTTAKIEGRKRQARWMLGSTPYDAKETIDSQKPDDVEDVAVMDYAQPHRKPPIHNKEP